MNNNIVFIGDFSVSGSHALEYFSNNNINPFLNVKKVCGVEAKLIANIECPYTIEQNGKPFKWANLKASPAISYVLDDLSVGILGNNHIGDYGNKGALDTINILKEKKILYCGYGNNIQEALEPAVILIDNFKVGIISLCCPTTNSEFIATHNTPGVATLGLQILLDSIKAAKEKCDFVIPYIHWGLEWKHEPTPDMIRLAHHAIDNGADAVVGCHSHTIQGYEQYKGKWIFYSLGNFLFGPDYGQEVKPDGSIVRHPLKMENINRESLVVSFNITQIGDSHKLVLDKIRTFFFDDSLIPYEIDNSKRSFDILSVNKKINRFHKYNQTGLKNMYEIPYRSVIRNGVLAYWYLNESIEVDMILQYKKMLFKYPKLLLRKVFNIGKRVKKYFYSIKINTKIKLKWYQDKKHLPLTKPYYELYEIIHKLCLKKLGEFPNLINCRDFNDRIQWLKLFDQDKEIIRCSDKILVRDFVKERVGEKYLVELYQVCDKFNEIDFDKLPNSFVIKTNHDSGTVILVRDKDKFDKLKAKEKIENSLKTIYGWFNGEWAYSFIKPRILVEEFINPENEFSPPDYKFYCVEGKVKFCHYIYDRNIDAKEQTIDPERNDLKTELYPSFKYGNGFVKQSNWVQMIRTAEKLGNGFKCVRVDLFNSDGRIYCGEMTFWPMAGHYKGEGQKKLGTLLDFDRTTYKPFLLHILDRDIGRQLERN